MPGGGGKGGGGKSGKGGGGGGGGKSKGGKSTGGQGGGSDQKGQKSGGGILDTLGIGGLLGKPDVAAFEDTAAALEGISALEHARRLGLQEPLRARLFGGSVDVGGSGGDHFRNFQGDFPRFLDTGELPTALRAPYQLHSEAIAQQGQQARGDIVRNVGARGGQLTQLLGQQRLSEAQQQAQIPLLEQPLREALFQQALGTAVGNDFPVVQGFGTSGQIRYGGEELNLQFKSQLLSAASLGVGAGG
jgi:hypothetical protein